MICQEPGLTPDLIVMEPADVPSQKPCHCICSVPEPWQVES